MGGRQVHCRGENIRDDPYLLTVCFALKCNTFDGENPSLSVDVFRDSGGAE